jgi:hypothetical protein
MIIRNQQIKAFERALDDKFDRQIAEYSRGALPEETGRLNGDELARLIHDARVAASQYGITDVVDVIRYIHLTLALSPGFEFTPEMSWALPLLRNESLAPSEKLDQILERVLFTA